MKTQFSFVKLEKSEALQGFTQEKLDKLEKKYDFVVQAEIHFKRDEDQDPNGYICNILLSAPGPRLFSESKENSFEAAANKCVKDLEKQLEKRKDQMKTH